VRSERALSCRQSHRADARARARTRRAAGCAAGEVVLWDFETRGVARVLRGGHAADVAAVAWSHDGRRVVSAGGDGALNVWDVLTGEVVATARLASKPVRATRRVAARAALRALSRRCIFFVRRARAR
jgi:WD40 repeat protein